MASLPRVPLISVITVVYNGAATLQGTIDSVASQEFNDYEYVIVDGGSTDDTISIIRSNAGRVARWVSEPDDGVYQAMNKALDIAEGRWVYFLGADDVLLASLADVATYLCDDHTIYYGDVFRPRVNRIYDGEFSALKLAARNICHQAIFYPSIVWERYRYSMRYRVVADYELNMRCFSDPEIRFKYIPVTVALFQDFGGLSSQVDTAFERERFSLVKRHFHPVVFIAFALRWVFKKTLSFLNLEGYATRMYHSLLRRRQGRLEPPSDLE